MWSYSRLSTFAERPFEYRVAYLEKSARSSSVYTEWGTHCHDLVQDAYTGVYGFDEMGSKFDEMLKGWRADSKGYSFPTKSIEDSYFANIHHYYHNPLPIDCEMTCEKPILYRLEDDNGNPIVFIGYVDGEYWGVDEEGNKKYYVVDFKSSSKSGFGGKQLAEKSRQLKLYAAAISQQRGIPIDDIICRFDMLKYVDVYYHQKNGKWKPSKQERRNWVKTQEKKIRTLMLEAGEDLVMIDLEVEQAIYDNTIDGLPSYVKDKFRIDNCYIDVDVTKEDVEDLNRFIIENVTKCEELEKGDWETNFPEPPLEELDSFYYNVLAPQIQSKSKVWQENKVLKDRTSSITETESEDFFDELFS
ncbi:PD-(D/E)XK nuclease family protein [Vagococcus fluvialis]|uniref:PD-(D/E)XK nuclease family protein n=1 Tax=Vagococcus fluvialis TaxID=2738 RepID=UPI001D0A030C|nr:PD-(D/E)XK nuclease family protein [Vagococcus fluvialis]